MNVLSFEQRPRHSRDHQTIGSWWPRNERVSKRVPACSVPAGMLVKIPSGDEDAF